MEIWVDGRAFLEGPRWRADESGAALYVSDMHSHEVLRVTTADDVEVVAALANSPSGLGWLPDGRMLIVSMDDRRLLRRDDGHVVEAADLSRVAPHEINDMVVDGHGHAFISQFGFDFHHGERLRPAPVLRADPDGSVHVATDGLRMANGMVVTNDDRTLIVAESAGRCLIAFDLADDGTLSGQRVWAELPERDFPDGICIDAEDCVWVAGPASDRFVRVQEGGEITDVVAVPGRHAIACALGGDERRTLLCCTSPTQGNPEESRRLRGAKVEAVRVDVPGGGRP